MPSRVRPTTSPTKAKYPTRSAWTACASSGPSWIASNRGQPTQHPLFARLAPVIRTHALPLGLFRDLLSAFAQDVTKTRYADFGEVMDYCRRSANPVGRLLLHLYGETQPRSLAYSDGICASLQLINFLQDVEIDYAKGRIYLPQDEMARYGISERQIAAREAGPAWSLFMRHQIERARRMLQAGAPLGRVLKGRLGMELRMIVLGGERILKKLHDSQGDVFSHRPKLERRGLGVHRSTRAERPMSPDEYCRQKAAASGSSFYYSFLFLPPDAPARDHRAVRLLPRGRRRGGRGLGPRGRAQQARCGGSRRSAPSMPASLSIRSAQALTPVVRDVRTDARAPRADRRGHGDGSRVQPLSGLRDAGGLLPIESRVSSGELSARIFGYTDPRTLEYARALGLAFQLTNIIRDVGEDVRRNRIYLPLDELARFGLSSDDLVAHKEDDRFARLMTFQIERARDYYARAFALLPPADRKSQRPGLVMAAIYRTLLDEIEASGARVLNQRISLTPLRKLWIAWRTWVKA